MQSHPQQLLPTQSISFLRLSMIVSFSLLKKNHRTTYFATGCEHTVNCAATDINGDCTSIVDGDGDTGNDSDMSCIMRGGNTGGTDTQFCQPCVGNIVNRIHNDIACDPNNQGGGTAGRTTCVSKILC